MATPLSSKVTWGLLLAWTVHDAEEWFTMAPWSQRQARNAGGGLPVFGPFRNGVSPAHARTAIAVMGVIVAVSSAQGARSDGRSRLFQAGLLGFGLHALGHLAASARLRGYTPGVITAPTVVLPFSLWAWRELGAAEVRRDTGRTVRDAAVVIPVSLAVAHLAARAGLRARSRSASLRSRP
jgi:hypothetical protein